MNPAPDMKREYRTLVIIQGALIAAVLVYAVFVELALSRVAPFPPDPDRAAFVATLRTVLFAMSGLHLITAWVMRGTILKKRPDDDPVQLAAKMRTASIVTGALCEAPAIYGLLIFVVGRERRDFYLLAAYALLLLIAWFPSRRRLESWMAGKVSVE